DRDPAMRFAPLPLVGVHCRSWRDSRRCKRRRSASRLRRHVEVAPFVVKNNRKQADRTGGRFLQPHGGPIRGVEGLTDFPLSSLRKGMVWFGSWVWSGLEEARCG